MQLKQKLTKINAATEYRAGQQVTLAAAYRAMLRLLEYYHRNSTDYEVGAMLGDPDTRFWEGGCRMNTPERLYLALPMAFPELDQLFNDLLDDNRGPGYGIRVSDVAPDLSKIVVELRFLGGREYCCAEAGCHVPRSNERLVRLAAARSIRLPDSVVVRWRCRVEKGTRLQCMKSFGLPTESDGYEFEAVFGGRADGRPGIPSGDR